MALHGAQEEGVVEGRGQLIDCESARATDESEGSRNVQIFREAVVIAFRGMQGAVPLIGEQLTLVQNVASLVSGPTSQKGILATHAII